MIRFADTIIPRVHQVDHDPTMPDYFRDLTAKMIDKGDFGMFAAQDIFDTFEGAVLRHKFEASWDASYLVRSCDVADPSLRRRQVVTENWLRENGWSHEAGSAFLSSSGNVRFDLATRQVSAIQQVDGLSVFVPSAFHPYYCDELERFTTLN